MNKNVDDLDKVIEIHAIAKGRVQGVGFRATVQSHAHQLSLKGIVRNLDDGSVEIFVSGTRPALKNFLNQIKTNAGYAQVEEISSQEITSQHSYDGFRVIG